MINFQRPFCCLVLLLFTFLSFFSPAGAEEASPGDASLQDLIERGDRAARKARFETRTEEQLREALRIYRDVLSVDPDNNYALNRLSLGYFTLAEAYLSTVEERTSAYRTGYEYGLKSLRNNRDFARTYEEEGFKALKQIPESVHDVPALFWTGANLGRLDEQKGVIGSLRDLPALVALNRRVLELNEGYLGGGAHRALGSISAELLSRGLAFLQVHRYGFSWKKTRDHFERAVELAPRCLENYSSYAKYFALKRGKEELARDLLGEVLTKSLGDQYPLVNYIAKQKAEELMVDLSGSD